MAGNILTDADLQIAATASYHGQELASENLRHFIRNLGLKFKPVLANALSAMCYLSVHCLLSK